MIRLAKYLKPFIPMIVLSIVLLFVQAMSDLALPDYMSRIVNYGIQQGGVENAVPLAVRQSQMEKLILFMSTEDKVAVLSHYTLANEKSPDYETLVADYPALANESIYVLKEIEQSEIDRLNPVMGKAWLVVSGIEQSIADPASIPEGQGFGFDLSQLPPGVDVFKLLANLPATQRAEIDRTMDERFAAMGDSLIVQAAVGAVKTEYEALGMDTRALQNSYVIQSGILMVLLSLLSGVATVAVGYLSALTAAGLARNLRRAVFTRVENFSSAEFDTFSTASLITRSTNDVTQIQMIVMIMIRMVFYAPIMGVGGVIRAVGKSPSMSWMIGLAVLLLMGFIITVFWLSLPRFKIIQDLIDRLNLITRENLSGMMVVRAFNTQHFEENRFDEANRKLTNTSLFVGRLMALMMPVMMLIMNVLSVMIIWVGAHQVATSQMQVGDMIAFMQYAMQIMMAFLMLSFMFIILPRASVSADRIAEVLDTEPTIHDPATPKHFPEPFTGTIEFRTVSFRYPGAEEDVLHEISFTALPGQTTAFIGSTGSGKSTVVNLIPRFYDVTGGAILIDGTDIREVTQHDLRDKIGYIPQRGSLFSGTIESNLRYADAEASLEALKVATDIAQASAFIADKPEGLATEISQGGTNVSGGQRQRLSIARALVKNPPIYIFDDSFSALDFKTDRALRQALKASTSHSTVLIVAQRISTIKNAEQIIVLDEGRVVGKGSHEELMRECETYREIALSQLSMEELAA
ncbi:MAG: ATP-binding cassette domain-containing protein [Ardenticatenales bacterium]|nr:ATP-binding cassette domain-containing protein [Ardenticatenales bacterium]